MTLGISILFITSGVFHPYNLVSLTTVKMSYSRQEAQEGHEGQEGRECRTNRCLPSCRGLQADPASRRYLGRLSVRWDREVRGIRLCPVWYSVKNDVNERVRVVLVRIRRLTRGPGWPDRPFSPFIPTSPIIPFSP